MVTGKKTYVKNNLDTALRENCTYGIILCDMILFISSVADERNEFIFASGPRPAGARAADFAVPCRQGPRNFSILHRKHNNTQIITLLRVVRSALTTFAIASIRRIQGAPREYSTG